MSSKIEITLKEGDKAPDFATETNEGKTVSLSDFHGKNVVLFFYPRDNTPGCTMEACSFRDEFEEFKKRDVILFGISTDSLESHQKFVKKFRLPFPLLVDKERKIVESYGVWGEKLFMGKRFFGTHRSTFLIDPDGKIRKIWPKVKVVGHTAEVIAAL